MRVFTARREWLAQEGLRLDATTYGVGGLEARDRITGGRFQYAPLGKIAELFSGPRFARTYVHDPSRGTKFLSSSDILLADLQGINYLSNAATPFLPQITIREGWTLISCSGTVGNTAYTRPEMDGLAASQHVMRAVPKDGATAPGYLFAFLTSSRGQALIKQRTYGSIIQHIEPHHIADMPVPLADDDFQRRIHDLVAGAAAARTEAARLLDVASAHFDVKAGQLPSLHEHAFAAGSVPRTSLGTRLDAFHHVGWTREASVQTGDRIDDLAEVISTARVPRIYVEGGVPFLSGIDVFRIRPTVRVRLARFVADEFDARVRAGELAVQGSGQRYGLLGRAAYVGTMLDGWAASHDLFRIRATNRETIARIFTFVRSETGRRSMLRHSYGTSIPHVNPQGIAAVRVPPLPMDLVASAVSALEMRDQADADEGRAIREVEAWLG